MEKIQSQTDSVNKENQQLSKENQKLQDKVKMSQTDEYSEELIREKLGLVKAGEVPVINNSSNNK
jgi:cell division protein FtsB